MSDAGSDWGSEKGSDKGETEAETTRPPPPAKEGSDKGKTTDAITAETDTGPKAKSKGVKNASRVSQIITHDLHDQIMYRSEDGNTEAVPSMWAGPFKVGRMCKSVGIHVYFSFFFYGSIAWFLFAMLTVNLVSKGGMGAEGVEQEGEEWVGEPNSMGSYQPRLMAHSAMDAVGCVIILLFAHLMDRKGGMIATVVDNVNSEIVSPADFTLEFDNLPTAIGGIDMKLQKEYDNELKKWMTELLGKMKENQFNIPELTKDIIERKYMKPNGNIDGKAIIDDYEGKAVSRGDDVIQEVVLARDYFGRLRYFQALSDLHKKRGWLKQLERCKDQDGVGPLKGEEYQKVLKDVPEKLEAVEKKIDTMVKNKDLYKQGLDIKERCVYGAFITFKKIVHRMDAADTLSKHRSWLSVLWMKFCVCCNSICCCLPDYSAHKFYGKFPICNQPSEPGNIMWENMDIPSKARAKRVKRSALYTFVIIMFSFALLLGCSQAARIDPIYVQVGGLLTVIINMLLEYVLTELTYYEKPKSQSGFLSSKLKKIFVAQFFNTAILAIIVNLSIFGGEHAAPLYYSPEWFEKVGASIKVTMWIQAFVNPIKPILMFKVKSRLAPRSFSDAQHPQEQMEALMRPEFNIGVRSAQTLMVIFVCLLYSAGMPDLNLICFASLFVAFWADKYCLLFCSRPPPSYDEGIGYTFISFVRPGVFLHCIFGLGFYKLTSFQLAGVPLATLAVLYITYYLRGYIFFLFTCCGPCIRCAFKLICCLCRTFLNACAKEKYRVPDRFESFEDLNHEMSVVNGFICSYAVEEQTLYKPLVELANRSEQMSHEEMDEFVERQEDAAIEIYQKAQARQQHAVDRAMRKTEARMTQRKGGESQGLRED